MFLNTTTFDAKPRVSGLLWHFVEPIHSVVPLLCNQPALPCPDIPHTMIQHRIYRPHDLPFTCTHLMLMPMTPAFSFSDLQETVHSVTQPLTSFLHSSTISRSACFSYTSHSKTTPSYTARFPYSMPFLPQYALHRR